MQATGKRPSSATATATGTPMPLLGTDNIETNMKTNINTDTLTVLEILIIIFHQEVGTVQFGGESHFFCCPEGGITFFLVLTKSYKRVCVLHTYCM